jgi:multiple sugar transport system ATP-binding protein
MIYVTHDQVEAMTMGERIVVMKDGIVQQVASPLEIYNQPANLFVAGFLGSPPMNFLKGSVRSENKTFVFRETNGPVVVDFGALPEAASLAGKEATLGIRPEHCTHIAEGGSVGTAGQFEAVVDFVEPMGAETFLYVNTGAHSLVSRIHETISRAESGHRLRFQIDPRRAHLFDNETGQRIV